METKGERREQRRRNRRKMGVSGQSVKRLASYLEERHRKLGKQNVDAKKS